MQISFISFVISKNGRALIADDMGLGKTIEALGVASYYRDEWPLLIITPANVRHTWVQVKLAVASKFLHCLKRFRLFFKRLFINFFRFLAM